MICLFVSQWFFLLGEHFTLTGLGLAGIQLDVTLPLFWNIVLMEDRFHGTFWNARLAVNALFRMDVKHLIALVEAFHGANDNAIGVFASGARFGDDMSHNLILLLLFQALLGKRGRSYIVGPSHPSHAKKMIRFLMYRHDNREHSTGLPENSSHEVYRYGSRRVVVSVKKVKRDF